MSNLKTEANGYTTHPESVACYASECPHANDDVEPCGRFATGKTRKPRLGDLATQDTPCPHFAPRWMR